MTDRELMQQALNALEKHILEYETTEALRARLAQPEQEPVAWADKYDIERAGHDFYANRQQPAKDRVPLYTAPLQRKWIGLTEDDLYFWGGELGLGELGMGVLRAVDAHLREKNTQ